MINKERKKKKGIYEGIKMEEWEKHFGEPLEGEKRNEGRKQQGEGEVAREEKETEEEEDGIRRVEIRKVIGKMKKKKAPGIDGMPNEAWIYGGKEMEEITWEVVKNAWEGEGIPEN